MTQDDSIYLLQKIFKYLVISAIAVGVLGYVVKSNLPAYRLQSLPNQNVQVKYLSEEMSRYVHQNYSNSSRRLLVYSPELEWSTCPYLRDMANAFKRVKNIARWQDYYDFVPQVRILPDSSQGKKNMRTFCEKICLDVCIVDMQENWVYNVPNARLLDSSLEMLKK